MNYFQRMQMAIDYIEDNLDHAIVIEMCAKKAYMSVSGFYRMFFSLVGYTVKEYIRMRRLTMAYDDLLEAEEGVLSIAIKYEYDSPDSFTRAFKRQFGMLPSKVKSLSSIYEIDRFERLNLMEQYFETVNKELEEKYPDIKVIKELDEMKVHIESLVTIIRIHPMWMMTKNYMDMKSVSAFQKSSLPSLRIYRQTLLREHTMR